MKEAKSTPAISIHFGLFHSPFSSKKNTSLANGLPVISLPWVTPKLMKQMLVMLANLKMEYQTMEEPTKLTRGAKEGDFEIEAKE